MKHTYTFEELLPYLQPTEKFQFCLSDLDESDFFYHLKSDSFNIDHAKFRGLIGNRIQEYNIFESYCTDTVVGQHVYLMDGVVAWSTYQTGRKMGIDLCIHSEEKYCELLELARSCIYGNDEETNYKDCDLHPFNNMVFVYEYSEQAMPSGGIYAFMDEECIIRKVVSQKRFKDHYFGAIITYLDDKGESVEVTLEKANGRMVGFKFQNADFIMDNFINKSIREFIENDEIRTQFGEVKWSFKKDDDNV